MDQYKFLIGGVILIAGLVWWSDPFSNDEDEILAVLNQLEQTYYLDKGENKIAFAGRAKEAAELFSDSINVDLLIKYRKSPEIKNRKDLQQSMLFLGTRLSNFNLDFYDTEIEFSTEDDAQATALTSCTISYQDDGLYQATDMIFEFREQDGEWLIHRVSNETPLEF